MRCEGDIKTHLEPLTKCKAGFGWKRTAYWVSIIDCPRLSKALLCLLAVRKAEYKHSVVPTGCTVEAATDITHIARSLTTLQILGSSWINSPTSSTIEKISCFGSAHFFAKVIDNEFGDDGRVND